MSEQISDLLKPLRSEIARIDAEILHLLKQRLDYAEAIAEQKLVWNVNLHMPAAETQVLQRNLDLGRKIGLDEETVRIFTRCLMDVSLACQERYAKRRRASMRSSSGG